MSTQILKGHTYGDTNPDNIVNKTNLHALVDEATLLPGAITTQTELTTVAADDLALVYDTSAAALKKVQLSNLPAPAGTTNAKLADMATATIKGRVTAGTGAPEDLTPAQARDVLDLVPDDSTVEINTGVLRAKDAGITNAKLANMAVNTIKGRITAGTGVPEDLTLAQLRTLIDTTAVFTVDNVAVGTNGERYNAAHGLAGVPRDVRWVLRCTATNRGYAVDDEVNIECVQGVADEAGFSAGANATNVFLIERGADLQLTDKSLGSVQQLDETKWVAKCYARL